MTTYTDDQVREQLDAILNAARTQEVRIKARDGREYAVRMISPQTSPFDIPGVDLKLSAAEIVGFVREGREE